MAKKPIKAVKKSVSKAKAKPAKKVARPAPKAAKKVSSSSSDSVQKIRSATRPKNTKTLAYTQSEFLENIRGFCGLPKRSTAKEMSEDFAAFIVDALKRGYKLPLLGIGKIFVRNTKPRIGRNPATGEQINIPAKKRIRFTPTKLLKEAVLK